MLQSIAISFTEPRNYLQILKLIGTAKENFDTFNYQLTCDYQLKQTTSDKIRIKTQAYYHVKNQPIKNILVEEKRGK